MYRGVALPGDAAALAEQHLRYDITIIAPAVLGREYVKTAGHYHPAAPSGVPYGEVYEVLHGRAAYFMQQTDGHGITDAVVVYAGPGDKVNIPPGYGHVTVNIGDTPLVMCNLVAADFASVYGDYAERRGGAYYFIRTPDGLAAEANPRYPVVPGLREASPSRDAELGLGKQPLYTAWQAQPARFRYLVHPELLPHGLRPLGKKQTKSRAMPCSFPWTSCLPGRPPIAVAQGRGVRGENPSPTTSRTSSMMTNADGSAAKTMFFR
jgi:glucose-6-phosphate isomerase